MNATTTVKVRMDTGQAKQSLRSMDREKRRPRPNPAVRRVQTVIGGLGGLSAVNRVRQSSGSVFDNALRPFEAAFQQLVVETLGFDAVARKQTRDQTAAAFGYTVGRGASMDAARASFHAILPIREAEQKGLMILRQHPDFAGPTIGDLIKQALPGYFKLVGKSVSFIIEGLTK